MASRRIAQGLAWMGLALVFTSHAAWGQVPEPRVRDINERSGLISRFAAIQPNLPPDPFRDNWYDTRWADYPQITHPNCYKHNGLYGLRWAAPCTMSVYPYFYGSPGANTIDSSCMPCRPITRLVQNLFHPFQPVGMYYDGGSFVPAYDLDPLVTGPGPNPIPWFNNWYKGG